MPLSPFSARLALGAFLAIAMGIGTNLLVLQSPGGSTGQARWLGAHRIPTVDAEQLGRKALEALIGSSLATTTPARSGRAVQTQESESRRLGGFAPSSGSFVSASMPGGDPVAVRKATVKSVQMELVRRGYEPGTTDGTAGLVTRAAVMAYEHDQGLPLTADPSPEVLAHLRHGTSAPGAAIGLEAGGNSRKGHAEQVIRSVQQALGKLGYLGSPPDGFTSEETVRAIREFEMDCGLVPSGRISGPLVAKLTKQAAPGSR